MNGEKLLSIDVAKARTTAFRSLVRNGCSEHGLPRLMTISSALDMLYLERARFR